jgi:hypothetical protein|tara:strand:- start:520 stop:762 length:243 start_codon:yes stop_codon:yes gene_type:complete
MIRKGKIVMTLEDKGLIELESVGCCIDTKTGMTYPMYADGTHDEEMGCHLEDIETDEWFDALSVTDKVIVDDCMLELGIA